MRPGGHDLFPMPVSKLLCRLRVVAFAAGIAFSALSVSAQAALPTVENTLLIEPESFKALGPWQRTGNIIQSSNMPAVAFAGFNVKQPGEYHVWTLSQDFPASQPGTRRFLVKIDEQPMARESGAHGQDGWYWENVGSVHLEAGLHLLEIEDTARFYGRLDAILLSASDFDPNTENRRELILTCAIDALVQGVGGKPRFESPSFCYANGR